jgi:hypothetical protein
MSGVLNRLHVDSTKFNNNAPKEHTKEEKENRKGKKDEGKMKKQKRNHEGDQYDCRYRYSHEKARGLKNITKSTEGGTALPDSSISLKPTIMTLKLERSASMAGSIRVSLRSEKPAKSALNDYQHKKPDPYKPRQHLATQQPILVPVARSAAKKAKIADRIADSRLKGADLYVARLAWKRPQPAVLRRHDKLQSQENTSSASSLSANLSDLSIRNLETSATGSLYDDLSCCSRTMSPADLESATPSNDTECATSSRPCYRCISYMQWAGIHRVFWTNSNGEWEGGKVRDLVDALELGDTAGAGRMVGMFVTKHEVLMLRRHMGE